MITVRATGKKLSVARWMGRTSESCAGERACSRLLHHLPQSRVRTWLWRLASIAFIYAGESTRSGGKLFWTKFAHGSESVRIIGIQEQDHPVFLFGFGFPAAAKVHVSERDVSVAVESR